MKELAQAMKSVKMMITYIILDAGGNDLVTGPKVPFTVFNRAKYLGRQAVYPVCGWAPGRASGL